MTRLMPFATRNLKPLITSLMVMLLVSAIGCGFKLRGLYDIPEGLSRTTIISQQVDSGISQALKQALEANDVEVVNQAPYRIEILDERITRRTLSLDSSARAAEYELRGEVTFQVTDQEGGYVLTERSLISERSYNVDSSNITASESQDPILRQQIHQDLAQQIMRQYIRIQLP